MTRTWHMCDIAVCYASANVSIPIRSSTHKCHMSEKQKKNQQNIRRKKPSWQFFCAALQFFSRNGIWKLAAWDDRNIPQWKCIFHWWKSQFLESERAREREIRNTLQCCVFLLLPFRSISRFFVFFAILFRAAIPQNAQGQRTIQNNGRKYDTRVKLRNRKLLHDVSLFACFRRCVHLSESETSAGVENNIHDNTSVRHPHRPHFIVWWKMNAWRAQDVAHGVCYPEMEYLRKVWHVSKNAGPTDVSFEIICCSVFDSRSKSGELILCVPSFRKLTLRYCNITERTNDFEPHRQSKRTASAFLVHFSAMKHFTNQKCVRTLFTKSAMEEHSIL